MKVPDEGMEEETAGVESGIAVSSSMIAGDEGEVEVKVEVKVDLWMVMYISGVEARSSTM
jgi:hypothetical protein